MAEVSDKETMPDALTYSIKLGMSNKMLAKIRRAQNDSFDGRIYGQIDTWTETGRITVSKPDMHSPHKTFSVGFDDVNIRSVFQASPGHVLVSADYSRFELRIMAYLSGDVAMINELNSKVDIFRSIAAGMYGKEANEITEEERQQGKNVVYAVMYGSDRDDYRLEKDKFFAKYPGVHSFIQKSHSFCEEKVYVKTISGRRRYLPDILSEDDRRRNKAKRQSVNGITQGSASDIFKLALIRVQRKLFQESLDMKVKLVHTLHDQVIYEVEDVVVDEFVNILTNQMESTGEELNLPEPSPISLVVNVKKGKTWGDLDDI